MNIPAGLKKVAANPAANTEADWVKAIGSQPIAITGLAHRQRLLQWRQGRGVFTPIRSIAVVFDAQHKFVKISSRYQC